MRLWIAAAALFLAGSPGVAAESETGVAESAESAQNARFVSLRASKANVRFGPGRRYPIAWVFVRRGVPVLIVGRFQTWRRIRDWEGSEGWIHQSLLSTKRSVIVRDGPARLHRGPDPKAPLIARVERRAVGRLRECEGAWCAVEFAGRNGWIRRVAVWGVGPADG